MKKTVAVVIFAALGLGAAIADTHEDRETLMKANGGALKALTAAGQAMPFDPAAAKAPAQTLIDNAAKTPALFAPGTENIDQVKEGVQLVFSKLRSVLQSKGLKAMTSINTDFDVEKHEAITEIPVQNPAQKGKVIDEVQKGYYLNDKIIRFAKVVVGK